MQVAKTFGVDIDKDVVRRAGQALLPAAQNEGPWLTFIGHMKDLLER
jgi:hypothetical protein